VSIQTGTRLGSYEIEAAIGAGGMGQVYRARDTKLGRSVAIKVLPSNFANDPQRVARFEREAQLLAALNHPHIASIYGFEESAGTRFLVLELVDGQTLANRLPGTAAAGLGLDESLRIARQIVDALEAAHEKGIVHRDLKPGNIALTANGQVKVLDFGLARFDAADVPSAVDMAHSPTLTFAATQAGMILGTAAYMSPEQAKGRVADKRSDVWAFGCVLFEMLTGKRAFEGEDASDTIAAVLRGEPDWTALPADLPPVIQRLLRRCLAKDPRERLRDIGDVRFDLNEATTSASSLLATAAPAAVAAATPRGTVRVLPWALAAALAVVTIAALAVTRPWRVSGAPVPMTLNVELGADVSLNTVVGASAVLSPDGQTLAFVANGPDESSVKLYLRRLDHLTATPLAGTDDAASPFFSPDGQWVAFFAGGKLKKISVTGGAPVTLADAPNARGGSWGDDNNIVFQPVPNPGSSLLRVPAGGGTTSALSKTVPGDIQQRWPQALPRARGVLFTASSPPNFNDADIVVQPLPDGEPKVVHRGGYHARYVPSGHLVYLHQGTLFAVPFDIDRLEVTGQAVPVFEGVATNPNSGSSQIAISQAGTAVYLPGAFETNEVPVSWLDRTGNTTLLRSAPANWSNPGFSPDGERLAMDVFDGSQSDVWIYEIARDTMTKFTFDAADDVRPVWFPGGRRIAFASRRGTKAPFSLYWQRADGTGEIQQLVKGTNDLYPGSFHPSGKFLAYFELDAKTAGNLMILPIEGDEATGFKPGTPVEFLKTDLMESTPVFSPDGRWIAYLSAESGRAELYVRPFPGPGGKWQISNGPADDPLWSRTRNELFYTASGGDLRMMVAPYRVEGDSFRAEKPRLLSETRFPTRPRPPSRDVDVHPDGQRFAIATAQSVTVVKQDKVVFVFNFFEQLKRLTGTN
jgi:serine/threonine-protein kinase